MTMLVVVTYLYITTYMVYAQITNISSVGSQTSQCLTLSRYLLIIIDIIYEQF